MSNPAPLPQIDPERCRTVGKLFRARGLHGVQLAELPKEWQKFLHKTVEDLELDHTLNFSLGTDGAMVIGCGELGCSGFRYPRHQHPSQTLDDWRTHCHEGTHIQARQERLARGRDAKAAILQAANKRPWEGKGNDSPGRRHGLWAHPATFLQRPPPPHLLSLPHLQGLPQSPQESPHPLSELQP